MLLSAQSVGSAVHDILQSCDLFADISNMTVSKLIRTKHQESQKLRVLSTYEHHKSHQEPLQDYPDFDYSFSERKTGSSEMKQEQPQYLDIWLKQKLSLAKSRFNSSRHLREENTSLQKNLCSRYNLQDVRVHPDWTATTVKGHLLSLEKLLELVAMAALTERSRAAADGLKFVLGHSSFVSADGEVHLSCEDTLQQWLQVTDDEECISYMSISISL